MLLDEDFDKDFEELFISDAAVEYLFDENLFIGVLEGRQEVV